MKKFFFEVFRKFAVSIVSTILFAVFFFFLIGGIFASLLESPKPEVQPSSFLVLDLTMNLTERPSGQTFEDVVEQAITEEAKPTQMHLLEVLDALSKAKSDPKIAGILVEGSFQPQDYGCGYATIREMIDGLDDFKTSGKPVIGFCHSPAQLDYLVYSACDELYMDPAGTLLLNGLASQDLFLGDTLKKYGIGVQVVRTGRYKGAVEPFTSSEYSPENREQIRRLLEVRWADYLSFISKRRDFSPIELNNTLVNNYLFEAEKAIEMGFIDGICAHDQMVDLIIDKGSINDDEDWFRKVALIDYLDRPLPGDSLEGPESHFQQPKIAVLYVEGVIVDGNVDDGSMVGGQQIVDRIRSAWNDANCKAIVLRVNSPGGSVSGSDAILNEIKRARKEGVPVVVSMGAVAASGGYWIATECDRLFAHEQTITGSIGVFGLLPNFQDLSSRFGASFDAVKTHPSADLLGVTRPKSEQEMKVLQTHVESLYQKFLNLVAKGRGMNLRKVSQYAEGRVWMGKDAHELGLVQELGGLYVAIEHAAELASLQDNYEVIEMPEVSTPMDDFVEMMDGQAKVNLNAQSSLLEEFPGLRGLMEARNLLKTMDDPRRTYSWLSWYRGSFGFK
ncbi:MAG: signal peptide peptidase SppA [Opitutae bacterium]